MEAVCALNCSREGACALLSAIPPTTTKRLSMGFTLTVAHHGREPGARPLFSAAVKPSGFVVYEGPSMLDGAPIVCILTGLGKDSRNEKTGGGLYQTWILRRDINPIAATHSG